jgi:radical SAM protein with 4Fe4S-binding SPASM domain
LKEGIAASLAARLAQAESFHRSVRAYLLAREEDRVLIVPPNRVFKLGGSAPAILSWLDAGGRLADLPWLREGRGLGEDRCLEVLRFFDELRAAYEGRAMDFGRLPYDFSFTRLPILGELALTYRCNYRCRFCYASCGGVARGEAPCGGEELGTGDRVPDGARGAEAREIDELGTADFKRVIRLFKEEAKIPFFSFTGGEPLLRGDLEELAAYARSLGLRVNLITNGSLASRTRASSLRSAGVDSAQVSIESADPDVNDALCGVDCAWERSVSGLRALSEAGISVQTNTTITRANADGLRAMPAFLRSLGVRRFSMNLFIPSGRGLGAKELLVPYSGVGNIVDEVRREAYWQGLTFFWYSPTPYCLYNPVARGMGNKSCAALDGLLHVNPRGEILPCSSWPESMGRILERPFAELWFSERAAAFKKKAHAPGLCSSCDSFVACQGACPLYWREIGTTELPGARPVAGGS